MCKLSNNKTLPAVIELDPTWQDRAGTTRTHHKDMTKWLEQQFINLIVTLYNKQD